jgi:carboxyl-terminal processing protease
LQGIQRIRLTNYKSSGIFVTPILNSMKQIFKPVMLAAIFLFCSVQGRSQGMMNPQGKLDYAIQMIKYFYVDTVNEKQLSDEAMKAMVKALDPHTVYIPAEELKDANENLVGKFEGIGIQFNILNDTIMVTATISGGPSEKVGLRAGDRIVTIDRENVASVKITNKDVLKKLRGDKGTKVTVGIFRRSSDKLLDYVITRDQIPLFSVDAAYEIAPHIGYIKISRFADSTVEEFRQALKKLKDVGITSLILDLEGNGGGYLNRAYELADEFLSDGKKIVYTRGRNNQPEDYFASTGGGFEKGKLAVLIDETSASASEIVAGAIQDWDRGLIIGRRSFGKGLVQKPYMLPDGSMIRLTIAHYYTPSGRCIQKPYVKGESEDYELDISNRFKHGELTSRDSIHFEDTTEYFTNSKRMVYGGGGIMPDIFIPLDTTLRSDYYTDLLRKNVFNDFTLTYTDDHRNELKATYPNITAFKNNFVISKKFYDEFVAFGEKQGVKRDTAATEKSEYIVRNSMKALIARNLWDSDAFFEIANDLNPNVKKAIEAIQDNTFEKLKIAYK